MRTGILRNILFRVVKLIVLEAKTYCFRMQNNRFCNALKPKVLHAFTNNVAFEAVSHCGR